MSAREEILSKVRAALGPEPRLPSGGVARDYRATTDDGLDTFLDRLAHYDATTHVVDDGKLDDTVRARLEGRRIVAPAGIPDGWPVPL